MARLNRLLLPLAVVIALTATAIAEPSSGVADGGSGGTQHSKARHHHHRRAHRNKKSRRRRRSGTPAGEKAAPSGGSGGSGDAAAESRQLIWADEFNGAAGAKPDPAKWNFDVGGDGWGNNELQYYTSRPSNAELDGNGNLVITARREAYEGADGISRRYTSARLQTLGKFEFTYGLFEARIQVPAGRGLAPAFWTLGNEAYTGDYGWPGCGEIDAMEVLGSEPNVLDGTLHGPWPAAPEGIGGEDESASPLSAGFHTYGVEWEPGRINFLLDGTVYYGLSRAELPSSYPWPFDHPNFLLLNLAVGGNWPGNPDATTQFPARMRVDWVRVWH